LKNIKIRNIPKQPVGDESLQVAWVYSPLAQYPPLRAMVNSRTYNLYDWLILYATNHDNC